MNSTQREHVSGPVYDKFVGKTEAEVLSIHGKAVRRELLYRHRLRDELRQRIPPRLNRDFVEELKFSKKDGILYVWLESQNGSNYVVGDVFVPSGIAF